MDKEPDDAEVLTEFTRMIEGMNVAELKELLSMQPFADALAPPDPAGARMAHVRRPPLETPVILRVRVDLDGATPPIWRRLEIRSDLTLDRVHEVLQAAYAWWDYHLYMFSLGVRVWDRGGEKFLCPFDVEEGETDGLPDHEVRLDETLQEPGDRLHYIYDYGDNWELTIKLEKILPLTESSPDAVCTGGRRTAPPEDCGSLRDAESLAEILPDPSAFDPAEVNEALADTDPALTATATAMGVPRDVLAMLPPRLVDIIYQAAWQIPDVDQRLHRLDRFERSEVDVERAVAPFSKFMELVGDGVRMTAADYIPPSLVRDIATFLPGMADWPLPVTREEHAHPVWVFREANQDLGFVRKHRGDLVPTAAGRKAVRDPSALWGQLARRLPVPPKRGRGVVREFNRDAVLVALFYVATGGDMPSGEIARVLGTVRWTTQGGRLESALGEPLATPRAVFDAISSLERDWTGMSTRFGPEAQALALAALESAVAGVSEGS